MLPSLSPLVQLVSVSRVLGRMGSVVPSVAFFVVAAAGAEEEGEEAADSGPLPVNPGVPPALANSHFPLQGTREMYGQQGCATGGGCGGRVWRYGGNGAVVCWLRGWMALMPWGTLAVLTSSCVSACGWL
jgi:hypothetical protein